MREAAPRHQPWWIVPAGTFVAILAFVSRQPNVLVHPVLWGEEGRFYFGNVYSLGLAHTLILPQAGYFQTYPVLVAGAASLVPMTAVPLVMALFGLVAQILPVPLLLSERSRTVAGDLRVRILLALLCLIVPISAELDARTVNAQWSLALAAFLVIVMAPARRAVWRGLDAALLLLSGLTGPFVIPLAVVAWISRRLRGSSLPAWKPILLSACAVLQILALLVISHRDAHNPAVQHRPQPYLGATPDRFARIVGGRWLLGTMLGPSTGLGAPQAVQWLTVGAGVLLVVFAIRTHRVAAILFGLMALMSFAGALVFPPGGSRSLPAWLLFSESPVGAQRYFLIPSIALLAALVSITSARGPIPIKAVAGGLLSLAIVVDIAGHWTLPEIPQLGFHDRAVAFEHSRRGTRARFPINPDTGSFTMILVKR